MSNNSSSLTKKPASSCSNMDLDLVQKMDSSTSKSTTNPAATSASSSLKNQSDHFCLSLQQRIQIILLCSLDEGQYGSMDFTRVHLAFCKQFPEISNSSPSTIQL